jgi:hypothetical protein
MGLQQTCNYMVEAPYYKGGQLEYKGAWGMFTITQKPETTFRYIVVANHEISGMIYYWTFANDKWTMVENIHEAEFFTSRSLVNECATSILLVHPSLDQYLEVWKVHNTNGTWLAINHSTVR